MIPRAEQETTVTAERNGTVVRIWTSNTTHLRKLRNDARATEVSGDEDMGTFTVPAGLFDPIRGFKRKGRTLSPEERMAAGERLRKARRD